MKWSIVARVFFARIILIRHYKESVSMPTWIPLKSNPTGRDHIGLKNHVWISLVFLEWRLINTMVFAWIWINDLVCRGSWIIRCSKVGDRSKVGHLMILKKLYLFSQDVCYNPISMLWLPNRRSSHPWIFMIFHLTRRVNRSKPL